MHGACEPLETVEVSILTVEGAGARDVKPGRLSSFPDLNAPSVDERRLSVVPGIARIVIWQVGGKILVVAVRLDDLNLQYLPCSY